MTTVFLRAIKPLVGHIPVEAMREANYMVDRDTDKTSPEAAARWLEKKLVCRAPPPSSISSCHPAKAGTITCRRSWVPAFAG